MAKNDESANAKIRVSLDLSIPLFERLEALEDATDESKAGVIRQALQLYEYVVQRTIEGCSFNLVADPCLSAREYLDELDRAGGMRVQRHATPIFKFYRADMMKWMVKVAVRHPERRMPAYRDWESRTQKAAFDCTAAKTELNWKPVSERDELVRRGIEVPLMEALN